MTNPPGALPNFADLEGAAADYATSRVVVLPVPLERTTSYGRGTAQGPQAILVASRQVELYDEELVAEPFRQGICTLPPPAYSSTDHRGYLDRLSEDVAGHLQAGKFVLALGGEHSLTLAPVRAAKRVFGQIGVVQFDAHADLRQSYRGDPLSHASVMRRVQEEGLPTLAVGIRSLSRREAEHMANHRLATVWAHELPDLPPERFRRLLEALPRRVYLTFDVDYLDPSLVPATGTPEPGGGEWYPTLRLLRSLFELKEVVAMDLVELAPIAGQPSSDFTVARLAYKCLGYLG